MRHSGHKGLKPVVRFFHELSRRRVIRVGIAYLVGAWILIEVSSVVIPSMGLPDSSIRILITLAALGLNRMGRYRGRTLFTGMIAAPLVMPEVITGLSLLLLFVSLQELTGWPGSRGANTIAIAHITFSMAYVAVIVQSRLASMDHSLEEAAMDLGGRPFAVTRDITLPLIAPAMASGWLLAFTLSLDDLVIASFTSGAGASTLPMVIFSKVKLGVTPEVNALATLVIAAVAVGVILAGWIMFRQQRLLSRTTK